MNSNKGSAQVVEISYVLPIAMMVVLGLVYLSFALFLYVHINNIALLYADDLSEQVGTEGLYWQLLGNYIDDDSLNDIEIQLDKELSSYAVLPGIKFNSSCSVIGKNHSPIAYVSINATYFGKEIFKVSVEKDVYRPKEFADVVDFGKSFAEDFKELKSIYDKFF